MEISPNSEYAITAKAELFEFEGRLDEAAKELGRIPNDSTDNYVLLIRATQALLEHNFDLAISWTKKVTNSVKPEQSLSDQNIYAFMLQGYCPQWGGRSEEARTTFERLIRSMAPGAGFVIQSRSETRSLLGMAYAGVGDKQNALEQARQAVADNADDAVIGPIAEAFRAKALAQLGEVEAAIDALPHLLEVPGGIHPSELRYSPYWDPLRKETRFEALLKNPPPVRY